MLSFGLIIFSFVSISAASAQVATPSVKITSPTKGEKLSDGIKTLTITGTSSDRPDTKCTVGVLINDFKPYKNVIPSGTGKSAADFSSWKYTFTPSNTSVIKEGNNRVTSKISCVNTKDINTPATQSIKYYSVNFTGVSNSYKPIMPSTGVNFAEMKKSKNVNPEPSSVTSVNNGIKEHKKIVENSVNKAANSGMVERKNGMVERKNGMVERNNGMVERNNGIENTLNPTNQSTSNDKGSVFVPPYNIKSNSGTTNSNYNPKAASNQTTVNTTNIIPGKVVISKQNSAKPNFASIPPKTTSIKQSSNQTTVNTTNIIPGKVVISNQSTTQPLPKSASIPPRPTITISINNSNSAANNQNPTSANTPSNNVNNSNITTSTIINEQNQGQNDSIPGSVPNGIGPSLIFPVPFHELESANLPSQASPIQTNPSNLNGNLEVQTSSNSPPIVAIKQSTSVVNGQEQVTLNGAASKSPSGSVVSYSWAPLNNNSSITSKVSDSPVFSLTVPKVKSDTHFAYRLTVTDSTGRASSATVDILAKKSNPSVGSTSSIDQLSSNSISQANSNSHVQVSNSNQNVNVSTAVVQSQNIPSKFLVNNDQVNIPSPNTASLFNSSVVNIPPNTPPNALDNANQSTLSAEQPNSSAPFAPPFASATTTSENTSSNKVSPVAVAGPDQIANGGSSIVVDGSGSYDPAGGPLSYKWDQISGPQGTTSGGSNTAGWSFKLPEVLDNALIKLKLTVTNQEGASTSDYLNIVDRAVANHVQTNHKHDSNHHD